MKKLITTLLAITLVTCVFAEIDPPHRYVEVGVDTTAGVSNDYFKVPDVMVKDLVIDLKKIADEMPNQGFDLNAFASVATYVNLNFKNFRLGFSTSVETSGYGNVSKDLFTILGNGNTLSDETQSVSGKAYGDLFVLTSVSVAMKYLGFRLKFTPTLVTPVIHADSFDPTVSYKTTADGQIKAVASSTVNVYTADSLESITSSSYNYGNLGSKIWNGTGLDLSAEIEYPLLSGLDVGAFTRVPIIPGRLYYKGSMTASASYESDGVLNDLSNNTSDYSYSTSDWTYSDADYMISRPLRFGLQTAYRPFGDWLKLYGMFGIGVRYPFTDDYIVYPEYSADLGLSLFGALGVDFSTSYQQQIFIQQMSLMLNARVLELDMGISLQGSDFVNSFGLSGIGAVVGVKMGF